MSWIDVHTHLEMLESLPEDAIRDAQSHGVSQFITIGTHPDENIKVLAIAKKHFPIVACTLGIHPHESKFYSGQVENEIESHFGEPWVVGIGEIGLDYCYDHSDRAVQRDAFRKQMELAARSGLPIQIHTRDAEDDTIAILKEFEGRVLGMFHCFTGTVKLAEAGLAMGYNISFSGIITFKTAEDLRDVVKRVPLDRIHVETDAPFLAPIPMRGKKNKPSFIVHTAKKIAELKGVPEAELSRQLEANTRKLFPKLPRP
jgi:TatD DNase family protein